MSQDPHWTYIILAYGVTFLVVGVMTWRIVSDHRRLSAEFAKLRGDGEDA